MEAKPENFHNGDLLKIVKAIISSGPETICMADRNINYKSLHCPSERKYPNGPIKRR